MRGLFHTVALILGLGLILWGCSPERSPTRSERYRTFPEWEASHYHRPIEVRVGWYPYEESPLVDDEAGALVVDTTQVTRGEMPVILVSYPDSVEEIWLDVDIDDALLGKLLKHSMMTQIPVRKPFEEYLEEATCISCHPGNVQVRKDPSE
jgi:hypothetical protein